MLTGLAAGQRRSNSMTSLDLIDLLEGGEARECLSDDVVGTPKISPSPALFSMDPHTCVCALIDCVWHPTLQIFAAFYLCVIVLLLMGASVVVPGDDGDESGGWEHCVFETDPEKSQFRMFTYETNKFLLSARRNGDDFYISQYMDFPEECVLVNLGLLFHPSLGPVLSQACV